MVRSLKMLRYLAAAVLTVVVMGLAATSADADIAITGLGTSFDSDQAGAASDFTLKFDVARSDPDNPSSYPSGVIKDMIVDMPKGFVGDPTVATSCPMARLTTFGIARCPLESVVGVATLRLYSTSGGATLGPYTVRVYRVDEMDGEVAAFGFNTLFAYAVRLSVTVDPENEYRIRVSSRNTQAGQPLMNTEVKMWGLPANFQGAGPFTETGYAGATFGGPMPASTPRRRFVTVPARCDAEPLTTMYFSSWQNQVLLDPIEISADTPIGCENLVFSPAFEMKPTVAATTTPSGYRAVLQLGQIGDFDLPRTPNLKDAIVMLPEGVGISPSSANGLKSCSDEQLALNSKAEEQCPAASKIGDVVIQSPVLEQPVPGEIFVGSQVSDDPTSGEMFRIFIVGTAEGVKVKLRGQVAVDPQTGQVTARFLDNPDLPVERMTLDFKAGDRAPLTTPDRCGEHAISSEFTSWAGQSANVNSIMEIDQACGEKGFAPKMKAGSTSAIAGSETNFVLAGSRTDSDQEVGTLKNIQVPPGLLGNVGSVDLCEDALAAAGNCPAGSRIGRVQVAAGLGADPVWVPAAGQQSSVSLTGPYKGAPYGLSIVVPAKAGPFDLGKVVVRSALHVDERTAQLSTGIDESRIYNPDGTLYEVIEGAMPNRVKGIALQVKQLRVIIDRKGFMVNPTNCSVQKSSVDAVSVSGVTASLSSRFQVGECASLGFAPGFSARILDKGRKSTLRSFHPRTRFTVVPRKGDANIAGARVVLPSSTLLDQANIGTTCTRAQMAARDCPEASIVGYARAWSPLLRRSLEGPVYLAANGGVRPLPDLAAVLDGEIRVVLQGEIETQRSGGRARLQNTFRVVPDAPVERFELTMQGGKKRGLLVNSTDLCRSKERGVAVFFGQNGRSHKLQPRIATSFRGCGKVRRQAARRLARKKAAAAKAKALASRGVVR